MNNTLTKIFDDLDELRKFCVEFGMKFNEADLYKERSPWSLLQRQKGGKKISSNWDRDRYPRSHRDNRDNRDNRNRDNRFNR